mgnify:CR=1 FL=1
MTTPWLAALFVFVCFTLAGMAVGLGMAIFAVLRAFFRGRRRIRTARLSVVGDPFAVRPSPRVVRSLVGDRRIRR